MNGDDSSRTAVRVGPRFACLSIALALIGCSGPLDVTDDPTVIQVEVSLDSSSVRSGDTLTVRVTATNTTDRSVRVRLLACSRGLNFEVRAENGEVVRHARADCLFPPAAPSFNDATLDFGPGQVRTARFDWPVRDPGRLNLSPGRYEVRGVLETPERLFSGPTPVEVLPLLRLEVSLEPPEVLSGGDLRIRTRVTNESGGELTVPSLDSCRFGVWVEQDGAAIDVLTPCPEEEPKVGVAPGARLERTVSWRASDPGDYTVRVQYAVPDLQPGLDVELPVRVGPPPG